MNKLIFFTILLISNFLYAGEWEIDCPKDILNAGNCASYKEDFLLKKYPYLISRENGSLIINSKRKQVALKNGEEFYYAIGYIPQAELVLVRIQYWEGNSHYVIDTKSGGKWEINGFPAFNTSFTKFVTTDYDLEAQYSPNNLGVFIRNGVWHKEYYLSPPSWGASDPVWVNDELIHFKKVTMSSSTFENKYEDFSLYYSDGNWWLSPLNKAKQAGTR